MPCFSPLEAFKTVDGQIVFKETKDVHFRLKLACGQCIGCKLARSRNWAIRCLHESQMHASNCFITLTYNSDSLSSSCLNYDDFQLFMRRLRKRFKGSRIRFYMCGEYGELNRRPHFHACLFGFDFPDREYFRTLGSGCKIYTSKILEELWPFGYCSIGDVTFESAAYIARYITKKVTGDAAEAHYRLVDSETGEVTMLVPEFTKMSLKPGIGKDWFLKFGDTDITPFDRVVVRGKEQNVPKYYKGLIKLRDPFRSDEIDFERVKNAEKFVDDCTEERLRVREVCARARLNFKPRTLE